MPKGEKEPQEDKPEDLTIDELENVLRQTRAEEESVQADVTELGEEIEKLENQKKEYEDELVKVGERFKVLSTEWIKRKGKSNPDDLEKMINAIPE